jgi:hypothetical protein
MEDIVNHGEDDKKPKDSACPVHLDQCRVWYRREEDQNGSEKKVAKRDKVDWKTCSAKTETRRKKRLATKALSHHASNDDDVGTRETNASK